jgi:hypothetical protein
MLYSIEEINQALLATYTLHVQETKGAVDANVIGHLGNIIHHVNGFEIVATSTGDYWDFSTIGSNMWDALDSLKSLSEILGEKHRLVRTAALTIGAAQDRNGLDPTLGLAAQYFNIEVDETGNVVSVANGTTKVPFTLEYRLSKYGRRDAQLTWLGTYAKPVKGDIALADIADLLCEPAGPELLFKSYKAAEQIMEMLEPFVTKALEPLSKLS